MKNLKPLLTSILLLGLAWPAAATEFYVAPNGTAGGNGTQTQPWDLQTALNQPSTVKPGDTIWLRGGTYQVGGVWTVFHSALTGAANQPITVRQYPGEHATINGSLFQYTGGWVNYWGFEIMNAYPTHATSEYGPWPTAFQVSLNGKTVDQCVSGVDLRVPNVNLINLVVHDNIGGGFGVDTSALNSQIYGCLSYYNGWQGGDRGHGHGTYSQNADPSTATIEDSIFFENYALGIQITGSGSSPTTDNFRVVGNAVFFNGNISSQHQQNLLLGAYAGVSKNPIVISNYVYDTQGSTSDTFIGYDGGDSDAVVQNNYFQTSAMFSPIASGMVVSGNTFLGGTVLLTQSSFPNNNYSTAKPTANVVAVRPNKYEPGRANIIVYNWQNLSAVPVDISGVLPVGTPFEVVNAQNFYGAPVLSGAYQGGIISLPMTGLTAAKPAGLTSVPATGPLFNVFVLLPLTTNVVPPVQTNTPPTISTISSQTLKENSASAPISFTVGDLESAAGSLAVSAASSNPTLLPQGGLVLSGTGAIRTLTLTPATNQFGTTTVTLTVSDGVNQTKTSFGVAVTQVNQPPQISALSDLTLAANASSSPLSFTVSDLETAPASLTVTAVSSTPTLLPVSGIALGGSGSNRTVTLTPTAGQSGSAVVTLTVSDGSAAASTSFALTVTPPPAIQTIQLEAESGVVTAPMRVVLNASSGVGYVSTPVANQGSDALRFTVAAGGAYVVWCRVLVTNFNSDSVFISMDGGTPDVFDMGELRETNAWQWVVVNGRNGTGTPLTLNPRKFSLSAGSHVLAIGGREPFAAIDKLVITSDLTYTPQDEPPLIQIEAEAGKVAAPMTVGADSRASGGHFVSSSVANSGTVSLSFNVVTPGTYMVWCRVLATNYTSDSIFASMDGGTEDVFDMAEGCQGPNWQWTVLNGRNGTSTPLTLNPRAFTLNAGSHTLTFRGREANAALDKVILTTNPQYKP